MWKELNHIPQAWQQAGKSLSFRKQLLVSVLVFVIANLHNFHYLRLWQSRPGFQINDLVLNQLLPIDLSAPIFCVEYAAMFLAVMFIFVYPDRVVKGLQMFTLVIIARTMTIYLVPLEPPRDMIALYDPLANLFLHTSEVFVSKDLFFSGHVAALFLLMLLVTNTTIKRILAVATALVAFLILWQHVHYTTDILFAPFVSYAAYRFVLFVHQQTQYGLEMNSTNA